MEEFIATLLKKVKLECILCRKMVDATIEGNEALVLTLNEDFKRIYDGIEEYVRYNHSIKIEDAMAALEELNYPSLVPFCAKELLHHMALRDELGEELYEESNSLKEEVNMVEYTLGIEEYEKLEGEEKNIMFEYITMTIFNSPALVEAFKGNYEKASELQNPENFIDPYEINIHMEQFLKQYLANHFYGIDVMVEIKKGQEYDEDLEASRFLLENYEIGVLNEKMTVASIYAVGREREIDISLPDYEFQNDESIEIVRDAAEMGENYLKRYSKHYSKIRIDKYNEQ